MFKYIAVHGFYYPSVSSVHFSRILHTVVEIEIEKETSTMIYINGVIWDKISSHYRVFDSQKEAHSYLKNQ